MYEIPEALAVAGWTKLLGGFVWIHSATLTTRFTLPRDALYAALRNGFIRRIARIAGRPVPWFATDEMTQSRRPHLHVLVGNTESLTTTQLSWAWKEGHSRISVVRDPDSAIRYTVKNLGRYPDRYDMSRVWTPASPDGNRAA